MLSKVKLFTRVKLLEYKNLMAVFFIEIHFNRNEHHREESSVKKEIQGISTSNKLTTCFSASVICNLLSVQCNMIHK